MAIIDPQAIRDEINAAKTDYINVGYEPNTRKRTQRELMFDEINHREAEAFKNKNVYDRHGARKDAETMAATYNATIKVNDLKFSDDAVWEKVRKSFDFNKYDSTKNPGWFKLDTIQPIKHRRKSDGEEYETGLSFTYKTKSGATITRFKSVSEYTEEEKKEYRKRHAGEYDVDAKVSWKRRNEK